MARPFIFQAENAKIRAMESLEELEQRAVYEAAAEGGFIAYVADFPGANTQGETLEEAKANLEDAISLLLECR